MDSSFRACLWVFLCLTLAASTALAQDSLSTSPQPPVTPPPAHVSFVDGAATIDRDGERDAAVAGVPLVAGDRIRTEAGRVEILFSDGSALHLDENTTADLLAGDLIRLIEGRLSLHAAGAGDPSRAVKYQIDAPAASIQTNWPGQYRMAAVGGQVDLAVIAGEAALATDSGSVTVRAGEQAHARDGQAPSAPQYFNSARWDSFDQWSAMRRDARLGTASAQYLPQDLHAYSGTFDRYGTWREEPEVGNVWYPAVAADWRPYYNGYWEPYRDWGSVWIGSDPWGYATHHYGRWGFSAGFGWYWAPSSVWGPSWVYWGSGSGYVSWCPLGRHGGPVFGLWGVRGSYYGSHIDPWRGWTVIPHHAFGRRVPVSRTAVDGRRLPAGVRGGFAAHRASPRTGVAVPRSWAGGRTGIQPESPRPGRSGGGSIYSGGPTRDPRDGSAGTGAVRRYGRGDGTGLAQPFDRAAANRNDSGSRARRSVPGSVERLIRDQPTPSEAVGMPGRRAVPRDGRGDSTLGTAPREGTPSLSPRGFPRQDGRDRGVVNPTPSEVIGRRPTPSEAVGVRPRRELPSASPVPFESSNPGVSRRPPGYSPRASTPSGRETQPAPYSPPAIFGGGNRRSPSPGSSRTPPSYESSRPSPRTYESRSDEPRAYQPPASSPRRNDTTMRSYEPPASSPRTYGSAPRTYGSAPGNDSRRSYGTPSGGYRQPAESSRPAAERPTYRGGGSPRQSAPAPRYNPGTASPRGGASQGAPSRRRSSGAAM